MRCEQGVEGLYPAPSCLGSQRLHLLVDCAIGLSAQVAAGRQPCGGGPQRAVSWGRRRTRHQRSGLTFLAGHQVVLSSHACSQVDSCGADVDSSIFFDVDIIIERISLYLLFLTSNQTWNGTR